MWEELGKTVVAALVGAFFALQTRGLEARGEAVKARCRLFVDEVYEAADLGAKYWLLEGDDPQIRFVEVQLFGIQRRLSHHARWTFERFRTADRVALKGELATLFDALTGGDFSVRGRPASDTRASATQAAAADVVTRTMNGLDRAVSLKAIILRRLPGYRW